MVWVHHELEGPAVPAARHLGVAHGMVVPFFPGHQTGESVSAPLHQVQPGVLVERGVSVGGAGGIKQAADGIDVRGCLAGS